MAETNQHYPDHLNPFGSDDGLDRSTPDKRMNDNSSHHHSDYPEYLSPFGEDDDGEHNHQQVYDNSLNPFEEDEENDDKVADLRRPKAKSEPPKVDGNPFDDDEEEGHGESDSKNLDGDRKSPEASLESIQSNVTASRQSTTPQPESLEPPKPLPRTKSLLKKEQALKRKKLQENDQHVMSESDQQTSMVSTVSSTSAISNMIPATTNTTNIQPRKNKRNAPPVPINFKRQVSGSLEEIETELNEIGDKLATFEKESSSCQDSLKATHLVNEAEFEKSRLQLIELIKSKNAIVRRQKELMYRKRELKLDQIYSDIEYELRMIGNKQLSHRTSEDEIREKELLKKLVEIVEEKNDIVENLNKDTSSDSLDINEAFRRLNINYQTDIPQCDADPNAKSASVKAKNEKCDKIDSQTTTGIKFSKIATLLPKSGTIKGTIKMKRKRLFKKGESRQVDR